MPSAMHDEMPPHVELGGHKSEKKRKKDTKEHHKKRRREVDDHVDLEENGHHSHKKMKTDTRLIHANGSLHEATETLETESSRKVKKHKHRDQDKSKKHMKHTPYDEIVQSQPDSPTHEGELSKKKLKHKFKRKHVDEDEFPAPAVVEGKVPSVPEDGVGEGAKNGKTKKDKLRGKQEKKRKGAEAPADGNLTGTDLAIRPSLIATNAPSTPTPAFPFFTQTISLYVPLYPVGFANPHASVANQHLKPLLNRHSQLLGGVLLDYRNPRLSEHPASRAKPAAEGDRSPALLISIDEYTPAFGWMTADVDLFVPSRNAPMEGTLNLQSEGHIGVVCWARFNASIEASRLPRRWRWVDLAKRNEEANARAKARVFSAARSDTSMDGVNEGGCEGEEGEANEKEEDALDAQEDPFLQQMHTTGYWVDETGRQVKGKLQFRIKNFDVGLGGDYGYLSIEGTMLGEDDERELAAREHEATSRSRSKSSGLLGPETKRIPEFSMTRFGASRDDQEDDGKDRTILYKSRPSTPDD